MSKSHDETTRLISLNPHLIGLEGIALSTGEVNLFKRERIYSQPDNLLFDPSTGTLYNIEYKTHHNHSQGRHAANQLKRAEENLKYIFPNYKIINLYVHDNFMVEVFK